MNPKASKKAELFQSALFEPIVKIGLGCVIATDDKLLGGTIGQQAFDLGTIRIEFAFPGSGRSSEDHSLRLLEVQGLLSTLRNQVAFDLRSRRKGYRIFLIRLLLCRSGRIFG
jgi:hypothetical protein